MISVRLLQHADGSVSESSKSLTVALERHLTVSHTMSAPSVLSGSPKVRRISVNISDVSQISGAEPEVGSPSRIVIVCLLRANTGVEKVKRGGGGGGGEYLGFVASGAEHHDGLFFAEAIAGE